MDSVSGQQSNCHPAAPGQADYLFLGGGLIILLACLTAVAGTLLNSGDNHVLRFCTAVYDIAGSMYIGVLAGIIFIGALARIPRDFVISIFGSGDTRTGLARAVLAGVLLDLCSHGILMAGARLYERGISTAQLMAFLIASPWNSFSLTLILWSMIGFKWTLIFLVASMAVALCSGFVFNCLVKRGILAENPNRFIPDEDYSLLADTRRGLANFRLTPSIAADTLIRGIKDSRMVLRWIFLGIVIAALLRTFMHDATFATWFGPTLAGLGFTLLAATIMEVCSEGTLPVAADIVTRAHAPGNGFTFLMAGVATDYTEILVIRETTTSWRTALFLPLVTTPQILLLAVIFNMQ